MSDGATSASRPRSRPRSGDVLRGCTSTGRAIPEWFPGVRAIEEQSGTARPGAARRTGCASTGWSPGRCAGGGASIRRALHEPHLELRPLGSAGKATMRFFEERRRARGSTSTPRYSLPARPARGALADRLPPVRGRAERDMRREIDSFKELASSTRQRWAPEAVEKAVSWRLRPATFEELMLDFLAYMELERGVVPEHASVLPLRPAPVRRLPRRARDRAAEDAGPRDVSRLPHRPRGRRRRRAASRPRRSSARRPSLRSFYRHLRREGVRESDPTAGLSTPRKSQKLPHVLGRAEVQRLLEQPKGTDPIALRDRALLELMYACGLRASEAIALEPGDVDLRGRRRCARAARARRSGSCRSAARP